MSWESVNGIDPLELLPALNDKLLFTLNTFLDRETKKQKYLKTNFIFLENKEKKFAKILKML